MSARERILAYVTLGMIVLGLLYLGVFKLIIQPTKEANKQAQQMALDVAELENQVNLEPEYRLRLRDVTKKSFGTNKDVALQAVSAHLTEIFKQARLGQPKLSAVNSARRVGTALQVGWHASVRASLDEVTNLLYLLQNDPHIHRIDEATWLPLPNSNDVEFKVRVMTLVLDPKTLGGKIEVDPKALKLEARLADAQRKAYDLIDDRDVFRPYIKKPPPPRPTPPPRRNDPPPQRNDPRPPPPRPAPIKLVGLPTWQGKPTAVVRNTESGETTRYELGADLLGGEIVAIDYRPMAHPSNPLLQSFSRVIVRTRTSFYAVEVGQYLSEKRRLRTDQLPLDVREAFVPKPNPKPVVTPTTSPGDSKPDTDNKPIVEPDTKPVAVPDDNPTPAGDNAISGQPDTEDESSSKETRDEP